MKPILNRLSLITLLGTAIVVSTQNSPGAEEPAPGTAPVVTPPSTTQTPETAPSVVQTPGGTAQPGAIIPIIVMDDAKLTDAIRNLARMAGLNYVLDPKLGFGQVDPATGKVTPEPTVSIRWENVTAEQALTALLNNYDLQIVEDPKSRIVRITKRDPAAPPPLVTKVIQLQYASPTNVIAAITNTFIDPKRSKAVPDTRTSQIVVVATEQEMASIDQMIERLDSVTKQVLIEARLLEMTANPTTTKGIDWSGTLQAQKLAFGNNLQQNSPASSVNNTLSQSFPKMLLDTSKGFNPATAFLDADGLSAVLSFLNKDADAKTISSPRTVTLDNETAKIEVTRATPIINVTAGTANTTGGSQIQYTNLGVILNVTPRISANDFVNLKVIPEVSRVFETQHRQVGGQPFDVDVYDLRKMETRVMIPSGNTLVLGGMIQDDVRNQNTKVPLLGDIPGLGYIFRSEAKQRQKGNLLIFITPTIVVDEDFMPTKSDFLKTPVPAQDYISGDWSAYDSAKPADLRKPLFQQPQGYTYPDK